MGLWPLHGREGRDTEIHVTIPKFCQSIGFWVDPERSVVEITASFANEKCHNNNQNNQMTSGMIPNSVCPKHGETGEVAEVLESVIVDSEQRSRRVSVA